MAKARVLTDKEIEHVEKLAAVLNQEQLADFLEISVDTFKRICDRDSRVMRVYKKARAKALGEMGGSLIQAALNGDSVSRIFYLKCQGRWKEAKEAPEDQNINLNIRDWTVKVKK